MKFPESKLAHKLLDGLHGIEIGPSAHNPFGLTSVFVGRSTEGTAYAIEEAKLCGETAKLDIIADGDKLPFPDEHWDFVVASHVLEHFYDPIRTIQEWLRVVRLGGYVFVIFPHKDRTFDKDRERTKFTELQVRHAEPITEHADAHWTVWITEDALELCHSMGWKVVATQDVDDKVGNGFTFVIQK